MIPTLSYQSGFGNEFTSESLPNALPVGQNSPQKAPYGLYAEVISGAAFTAPRHQNRRTWMYRKRPSAAHGAFKPIECGNLQGPPTVDTGLGPNRLRWDAASLPEGSQSVDFLQGLRTYAGNGDIAAQRGSAIHLYCANASMRSVLFNSDGEMLLLPQQGRLLLETELGRLVVAPGSVAVIPRGIRFRVLLPDGNSRGYVCENFGRPFQLPELGPIGSNGLANARDFEAPTAWCDTADTPTDLVNKFMGKLWQTRLAHSPFDVVAWHGNCVPYRYDLARFNAVHTVTFDHTDPSIFTVLTSQTDQPGTANVDFVIFPPRWIVAEHSFRPPWYHRNVMSEFMGLIQGVYDAKAEGFVPGGASLHNCMSAHGPDRTTYERAIAAELKPHRIDNTLAFMFESSLVLRPTPYAVKCPELQADYDSCWSGLDSHFST